LFISRLLGVGLAGATLVEGASAQRRQQARPAREKPTAIARFVPPICWDPDDQLEISGPELTDLSTKPVRIDGEGDIQVPLAGSVHVAGLTVQQTEKELDKVLNKYIKNPQVVVNVVEVRSQPVSVLGAVNSPGVHQCRGTRRCWRCWRQPVGFARTRGTAFESRARWNGVAFLCRSAAGCFREVQRGGSDLRNIMDAKTPEETFRFFRTT